LPTQANRKFSDAAALHKILLLNFAPNQLLIATGEIDKAHRRQRMVTFALCLTLGVLLAQTFRVFVLALTTLLIVVLDMTGDTATGGLWIKLFSAATAATALQAGYLIGVGHWTYQPPQERPLN
jgi:hypothetical protein